MNRALTWFRNRTGHELKHALVLTGWCSFGGYHILNLKTTIPANIEKCEEILDKLREKAGEKFPKDLEVDKSGYIIPAKKTTFLSARQDGREYAAGKEGDLSFFFEFFLVSSGERK